MRRLGVLVCVAVVLGAAGPAAAREDRAEFLSDEATWVKRDALGPWNLTRDLVLVDRARLRLEMRHRGRVLWTAPVGIGKPGTPTPAGRFWVDERFRIEDAGSGYYPYAFGTTAYSSLSDSPGGGVVGIHGPYGNPPGIPGRICNGCIRLRVRDTFRLARRLRLGTPVHVV